ncbi:MAG TPA: glycosyltransferase family 39 protein, partial [Anaerolineales bacterium]|nr:glycosyltransferase family 39 protein [Anaerolineales bacterium]
MKTQEMAQTWIQKVLMAGIFALGAVYLAGLVWLFSQRLVYPYELDWVEGGMLTSVIEILNGRSLYAEPTISYVPFVYAPVYFYVSALIANIAGPSLLALRLVSVIATLISLIMIVLIVVGETKSWFWGIISAGLLAGLYPASGYWFDLARVDSLFLMFFLFFLWALRRGDSLHWQILAGVFASLALLTKQAGLTMCLPIIGVYVLLDWKHRLALPLTTLLVYGGVSLAFTLFSDGWYIYYCFTLLLSEPINEAMPAVSDFVKVFFVPNILIATVLTTIVFLFWFFRNSKARLFFWMVVFISTILTSYAGKAKVGGVSNALIPTFAIFSIFLGMAIPEIRYALRSLSKRYSGLLEIGLCLLVLFQMIQVIYKPWRHAPTPENYRDGDKALQIVKKFDGNVYAPNSAISLMAGKRTFAHPSAVWEIVHSRGESKGKDLMKNEIQKAMDTQLFEAMVIFPYVDFFHDLQTYYSQDDSRYILVDENWHEKADVY